MKQWNTLNFTDRKLKSQFKAATEVEFGTLAHTSRKLLSHSFQSMVQSYRLVQEVFKILNPTLIPHTDSNIESYSTDLSSNTSLRQIPYLLFTVTFPHLAKPPVCRKSPNYLSSVSTLPSILRLFCVSIVFSIWLKGLSHMKPS